MTTAAEYFAGAYKVEASAPGRVNLLGEHTDYNEGFMLPVATPQRTRVTIAASLDDSFHFHSETLDESVQWAGDAPPTTGFSRYMIGCVQLLRNRAIAIPPLRMHVQSNLVVGAGLSSSAALELATLRALRTLLALPFDDTALAQIAQRAEIEFAGVNCGIMDQMASSLADESHMLFLDARTLETRLLPLPADSELIVIDSGVPRTLAATGYNTRRTECETAARLLGVKALRDITDPALVETLQEPFRKRARHVVLEDLRVLAACQTIDAPRFGALMNASHASLRDDYEVSIAALDVLTSLLQQHEDIHGARLTGAGFGGACVALCRRGRARAAGAQVLAQYNSLGHAGRLLIPEPAAGMGTSTEGADHASH
jgi:galactokinase